MFKITTYNAMKEFFKYYFFLFILIAFNANAQTDKVTTAKIVAAKNFVFVATSAIPMNSTEINNVLSKMNGNTGGGSISLTGSNYELKITADSISSYLPYYGRAFSSPIGNNENGIKFTSTKFSYEVTEAKKGWSVNISIKDTKDSERLSLNIGENGYASLNVNSNTKQSITYNGYIAEHKKLN